MAGSRTRPHRPAPSPSPSRSPALVIAASSLLLASGCATCLYVWRSTLDRVDSDTDGVEQDGAAVAAWWTGEAALRWSLLSAGGSLLGVLGLLLRNSRLHRVFAITTAVDLLATVLLALVLSLLTFTPALAPAFSTFLCSSTFISDFSASRSHEGLTWSDGVELVLWGVETCEESWRTGMIRVILGCVVAAALRVYGVLISWEANSEMREQELRDRGEAWVDQEMCEIEAATALQQQGDRKTARQLEETMGRPRSSSTSSTSSRRSGTRTSTLPLYTEFAEPAPTGKRSRSHTVAYGTSSRRSQHPQLVLVPVVFDQHGHPVYSPSSPGFALPPYASPPRSRSSTYHEASSASPTTSSRSSSRASKRSSRPRSSSSSSSSNRLFHSPSLLVDSPPLIPLTDEPLDLDAPLSPPLTPVAASCTGKKEEERAANRRARSRSENDAAQSSFFP